MSQPLFITARPDEREDREARNHGADDSDELTPAGEVIANLSNHAAEQINIIEAEILRLRSLLRVLKMAGNAAEAAGHLYARADKEDQQRATEIFNQ